MNSLTRSVLLVDEDEDSCAALSDLLRHRGMFVDCASSAAQAIEKVTLDEFSVVILDLSFSGGHGIELLRRLKDGHSRDSIIILTILDQKEAALRNGAFAFLPKPWNRDELLNTLSRATAAASG